MKKLLLLVFLTPVVVLQLHAQQSAPGTKRSTPTPTPSGKRSTPTPGRSSTPASSKLDLPVEAKPATPRPAQPSAPEAPKPRSNWEVYPADHMPPGKSLTEAEAAKLPSGDYSEKPLYLVGSFVVAMVHKDRAILWPDVKRGPVSIVVSYPLAIPAPQEATRVVREAPRGYRITRIKRVSADEVTIYARDITVP